MRSLDSVEEIMILIQKLCDELQATGHEDAAKMLTQALNNFYTTATEALGELRNALNATESIWSRVLAPEYQVLGKHLIVEATRLMNLR